ncbi:MAG TPA: ATP-binding cassette domain-containing protein, partial [Nordella sp.]|nr:ATP-binding cassette domain-containing protein [Nordella sp.]
SSGRVHIGSRDVTYVHPRERDIAMVFQSYALYPHMSVRRNMEFALELKKVPPAEIAGRIDKASEILGIGKLLDRRPRQLSGGQRQRVALGRAMVREPAVFLFDEPLSNLDAKLRTSMRSELIKLHKRLGTTIVYVTHDQVEAMTMGQLVVVMKDGVIQQAGAPMELYRNPANVFVAEFIGSPAMNLLPAKVTTAGGLKCAAIGDHLIPLDRIVANKDEVPGEIVLGIRPEHLSIAEPAGKAGIRLGGTVEVVETLGAESIIEFGFEGSTLIARQMGDFAPTSGSGVSFHMDAANLFVFDAASGKNLRPASLFRGS